MRLRTATKRTVYELEVDEVGPSLRNASAKVQKFTRTSGGQAQARP
jgi:single-strand DNA-binding protein